MEKLVGVISLLLVLMQLFRPPRCGAAADGEDSRQRTDLHVLVLSPRPNRQFQGAIWPGGPSLFPAAQLAADMLNNRTDILTDYSVRLVDGDSGCGLNTWATVTFAREAYRQSRVVGIVGPACSSAAAQIGGLSTHPGINLVAITIANGPQLRNKYSNMFRLISSSILYGEALFKLMKFNNWKSIATIYNIHQWYFRTTYTSFRNTVNVSSEYEIFPLPVEHRMFPLGSIHNKVSAIFVLADSMYIKRLLCLALKSKWSPLIYPNYQWIFLETHEDIILDGIEFIHDDHNYTCTRSDMSKASNRTLILRFRLQREDKTVPTDIGLTYDEFFGAYESYFSAYLDKEDIAKEDVPKDSEDWAATYFDSMWAMGLALNNSVAILKEDNMSLPDYQYGDPHVTSVIREQLLDTNFRGLSGDIHFLNETLEVPTVVDIYQLNPLYTGINFRIGYYYEENLIINEMNASFVVPIQKELKTVSTIAVAIFFPAALLTLLMTISLHILHFVFRNSKSIKAQSPHFSHLIFSGCYLFIISALLETVRAANWTGFHDVDSRTFRVFIGTICNIIFWCLTLGTCLIFGTVCVLSWRLYKIFTHFSNPGYLISDSYLVLIIVVLITVNSAVLLAWSAHDPLLPYFSPGDEEVSLGRVFVYGYCDCKYFSNWMLMWIVNEATILSVVILAVLNRHIPRKEFNNTRAHSLMAYVVSFLNGVCVPLYFIQLKSIHINYPYIILEFFTLGCAMLSCIFLFVPPVIPIFQRLKCNCTR